MKIRAPQEFRLYPFFNDLWVEKSRKLALGVKFWDLDEHINEHRSPISELMQFCTDHRLKTNSKSSVKVVFLDIAETETDSDPENLSF